VKRLYTATVNSLRGLRYGFCHEAAVREELIVLAAAVPLGVLIAPTWVWYIAMVGVLLAVLSVELLNTAIEKLADHTTQGRHPQIGMIKDYGSAAVLCMLCVAALIWIAAIGLRLGLVSG
jgi:diacylglycerol kinase (ATP)